MFAGTFKKKTSCFVIWFDVNVASCDGEVVIEVVRDNFDKIRLKGAIPGNDSVFVTVFGLPLRSAQTGLSLCDEK